MAKALRAARCRGGQILMLIQVEPLKLLQRSQRPDPRLLGLLCLVSRPSIQNHTITIEALRDSEQNVEKSQSDLS